MKMLIDRNEICNKCQYNGEKFVCEMCKVFNAPEIDAEPVVHSRWLGSPLDGYYCKNCLEFCLYNFYEEQVLSKYCPYCGARMDGDIDGID